MTTLDTETRRKLREMAAGPLLDALSAQDDSLTLGMSFEQRIGLAVDEATPRSLTQKSKDSSAGHNCAIPTPICAGWTCWKNAA